MVKITFNKQSFKNLCHEKKMTMESVFLSIGMTRQNMNYLLTNNKLKIDDLAKICETLVCTPNDLFDIDTENQIIFKDDKYVSESKPVNEIIQLFINQLSEKDNEIFRLKTKNK